LRSKILFATQVPPVKADKKEVTAIAIYSGPTTKSAFLHYKVNNQDVVVPF